MWKFIRTNDSSNPFENYFKNLISEHSQNDTLPSRFMKEWLYGDLFDEWQIQIDMVFHKQTIVREMGFKRIEELLSVKEFVDKTINNYLLAFQNIGGKKNNSWRPLPLSKFIYVLNYSHIVSDPTFQQRDKNALRFQVVENELLHFHLTEFSLAFFLTFKTFPFQMGIRILLNQPPNIEIYKRIPPPNYFTEETWEVIENISLEELFNRFITELRRIFDKPVLGNQNNQDKEQPKNIALTFRILYKRRREKVAKRYEQIKKCVENLIQTNDELQIVNIDLGYANQRKEMLDGSTSVTKIDPLIIDNDLTHLRNNLRSNSKLFGHHVGYVWRLDVNAFGLQKIHLLLFCNISSTSRKSVPYQLNLAQQVGIYWSNKVTKGRGTYCLCEKIQRLDTFLGFDIIKKSDSKKLKILDKHLYYMSAKDLYYEPVDISRYEHLIGHSRPKIKVDKVTPPPKGRGVSRKN